MIILHDCASAQDVKKRTSKHVKLAFSAHHYNLSTTVITQQLTSIAKPYHENISKLVTFYNPNWNDMKRITNMCGWRSISDVHMNIKYAV